MGRARERGDFEAALLFIAPESLDQGERVTREDWRRKWESMRDASPDLEIVTEQSVAEGEWIAHRYLLRGTHTGDFFGQPPTGAGLRPMAWTWSGSATASWSSTGPWPGR
jgi:predicted ester cyclase